MDAAAEIGRNPVVSKCTIFSLRMEMSRLMRDGTAEPVSLDQILRRERGLGNINFPCSADHEQDWQNLTRLIHTLAICDDYTVHTYIQILLLQHNPGCLLRILVHFGLASNTLNVRNIIT